MGGHPPQAHSPRQKIPRKGHIGRRPPGNAKESKERGGSSPPSKKTPCFFLNWERPHLCLESLCGASRPAKRHTTIQFPIFPLKNQKNAQQFTLFCATFTLFCEVYCKKTRINYLNGTKASLTTKLYLAYNFSSKNLFVTVPLLTTLLLHYFVFYFCCY